MTPIISYFSFLKRFRFLKRDEDIVSKKKPPVSEINLLHSVHNNDSFSIMIADDNENNLLQIKSLLNFSKNNITLADDGISAHTYLLLNRYDLIFLNPSLYCDKKEQLITVIRLTNSHNKDTPVVAITPPLHNQQRKILINRGFDECLVNPISSEQITEILNLWLPNLNPPHQFNNSGEFNYVDAMLETTRGDKELARTFFNKLFLELPKQIRAIEHELEVGNLNAAKDIAHKLHGSIKTCGFTDIIDSAKNLEISLCEKNLQLINESFHALKVKINNFTELQQIISQQL